MSDAAFDETLDKLFAESGEFMNHVRKAGARSRCAYGMHDRLILSNLLQLCMTTIS